LCPWQPTLGRMQQPAASVTGFSQLNNDTGVGIGDTFHNKRIPINI